MRYFALAMVMVFASISAQANLSGNWSGEAVYTNPDGQEQDFTLTLGIEVTDTQVNFVDEMPATFLPESAMIEEGNLVIDEKVVGTISDTELKLDYVNADMVNYSVTMSLMDGKLSFEDSATYNDQTDSVKGMLEKMEEAVRALPVFGSRLQNFLN